MTRDKQLAVIDVQNAKRKLSENLPLSLKELACALEIGYDTVLAWRRQPGFPYDFGKIFPSDYEHWRKERLGIESVRAVARPQHADADNHCVPSVPRALSATLPRKAALLIARAGL